jgi:hypothetical protein
MSFSFPADFSFDDISQSISKAGVQRGPKGQVAWDAPAFTVATPYGDKTMSPNQLVSCLALHRFGDKKIPTPKIRALLTQHGLPVSPSNLSAKIKLLAHRRKAAQAVVTDGRSNAEIPAFKDAANAAVCNVSKGP